MKNLMAKIKGFDYKGFFLRHGEKVGMGATILFVLATLGITNWSSSFAKSPQQLQQDAEDMEKKLRANVWPEDKKVAFAVETARGASAALNDPVNLAEYRHGVPMSPKLYTYRQPADEPVIVTVEDLRVTAGMMAMEVQPPIVEEEETPEVAALTAGRRRNDRNDRAEPEERMNVARDRGAARPDRRRAGQLPAPGVTEADEYVGGRRIGSGAASPTGPAGPTGLPATKARGVRYNAVVGVIDRKKQLNLLQNALHLENVADVEWLLEFVDFKIQRQRAVRGADPWKDENGQDLPWRDLNQKHLVDVLADEAVDFDVDVVAPQYIDAAFTCPLPHRLDGEWVHNEVGHPRIPSLDDDQREAEALANQLAAEVAGEEEDLPGMPRGFNKVLRDPNKLRMRAMSVAASDPARASNVYDRFRNSRRPMMGNPDIDDDRHGGGLFGSAFAAGLRARAAGAAGNRPAYYAGGAGMGMTADLLLFRYLDFDVEPGECYRYRVQIVIRNPSANQEYVSSPDVAAGEERNSDWSKPSRPCVVPRELEYELVGVAKRAGHREGAILHVVQYDTDEGTLISGTLKRRYGEYIAGEAKSTHLKLSVPSLEDENVTFNSSEILIDSASAGTLSGAALQDLQLTSKGPRMADGSGLDRAVMLNRFGELVPVDADSRQSFQPARQQFEEQNKEYAFLKEEQAAATQALYSNRFSNNPDDDEDRHSRGRAGAVNPLKRTGARAPGSFNPPPRRRRGRDK